MTHAFEPEVFMARARALLCGAPERLSLLGAGILAGLEMGVAADSRGFSRRLGLEHALVLREITHLAGPAGFLDVTARHPRTLRASLALGPQGRALLARTP